MSNEIIGQSRDHENALSELNVMRKMLDSIENHEYRISNLEDTMRINAVQESKLTEEVNSRVVGHLGGKQSNAYRNNSIRGKAYSEINKAIRKRFDVRRREIPAKEFKNAVAFIQDWKPEKELEQTIFEANRQGSLFEGM